MRPIWILVVVVVLGSVLGCVRRPVGEVADAVYRNGKIYTVNEAQPWVEAVAIKDGKFLKVGSSADVEGLVGDDTEVVDLDGTMVMPGIVDLHVHPFATPLFNMINLDFSDPMDPDKMLAELAAFAEANPDKTWIRAGSWGVGVFPDNNPSKALLDEVVPDRPVVLIDQTGHAYWLNSKALELAGIDSETPTDMLYIIAKDPATGEPTGVVRESAMRLVEQAAEQPTADEYAKSFIDVFREFNSEGVTTMETAEGNAAWLDVVQRLEGVGGLTMRLFIGWDWHMHLTTPYTNDEMDEQIANRAQYASEMVDPNFVKIFLDGVPDGYAVPLLQPYADGSGEYGKGKMSPEELRDIVVAFDAQGIGVFMHSIGDASARAALDAIIAAREINGDTGVRHKVAHLTWVDPDDMPRFASIPGVAAEISPAATYHSPGFESFIPLVGEERYQRIYPARSLINAGARLGYGSDWLTLIPPSPWMPMQGFVTRINPASPEKGVLGKDETLTVEQAIRVFTINGAYAVGAENRIGSIEEGKLADMIVLDRNLLEIESDDIRNTRVLKTILNGKVVFDRTRDEVTDNIEEGDYEQAGRVVH
jgi:predicted amidohydrolase YtcJ